MGGDADVEDEDVENEDEDVEVEGAEVVVEEVAGATVRSTGIVCGELVVPVAATVIVVE